MSVTAFLPCRAGSERIPLKNTRPFAGDPDGLLSIKLRQLARCDTIDRILLSTNDPEVVRIANGVETLGKLDIVVRPDHLCQSSTSTDELIRYVPEVISDGIVLWTHVTSPMVSETRYSQMLTAYVDAQASGSADSLMAVSSCRDFVWSSHGPINYNREVEKWPRTQTLEPLFVVNSAAFIIDVSLMRQTLDRVGSTPLLYELGEFESIDIDWPEQFEFAETAFLVQQERK